MYFKINKIEYDNCNSNKTEHDNAVISVSVQDEITKEINYFTESHFAYSGHDTYVCNLGNYDDESELEIRVTFQNTGRYSIGEQSFISGSLEEFDDLA